MICSGSYFLLSRPRRFGKSLTIDTLEQIFIGNKELFKGLYIYDEYDFEEYPVIRLNMSLTPFSDLKGLMSNLYELQIYDIAERYGIINCPAVCRPTVHGNQEVLQIRNLPQN